MLLHLSLLNPPHSNISKEFKGCMDPSVPKATREDEVVTAQRHRTCCRLAHLLPQHHLLCSSQAEDYSQDVKPSFSL
uniref:Uncharacterized protein n=1 Tax=Geospiza parvula TaxID=87175 RepID=A0A8C3NNR2_GEOPR